MSKTVLKHSSHTSVFCSNCQEDLERWCFRLVGPKPSRSVSSRSARSGAAARTRGSKSTSARTGLRARYRWKHSFVGVFGKRSLQLPLLNIKLVKNVMIKAVLGATTTFVLLTTSSSAAEFHFGDVLSSFQSCLAESVFDKLGATIREKDFDACIHSLGANGPGGFGAGFQADSAGLGACFRQRQPTILRMDK
jgi:hypothetical protein